MERAYLGQGIKYPTKIVNGTVQLANDDSLIQQSISIILSTPKGSRFMLPEFGSRLNEVLFEPNDEVLQDMLKVFIYEAISEWETRVRFSNVSFTISENAVFCEIFYKVLRSNEINSFVYPFYRQLKY